MSNSFTKPWFLYPRNNFLPATTYLVGWLLECRVGLQAISNTSIIEAACQVYLAVCRRIGFLCLFDSGFSFLLLDFIEYMWKILNYFTAFDNRHISQLVLREHRFTGEKQKTWSKNWPNKKKHWRSKKSLIDHLTSINR